MTPATLSLAALLLAIVLSMVSRMNIGILAIALAWLVGVYGAGMRPEAVMAGFPGALFLTLTGVTLLFACADANGTMDRLAHRAVALLRGSTVWLPVLMFVMAGLIATVGPGAISSVALVAPLAMATGERAGVPRFLSALMVANGANAGNLSAISAVGVIANTKMAEIGLGGHGFKVWFANFIAHTCVAAIAYVALARRASPAQPAAAGAPATAPVMSRAQMLTSLVIVLWIAGVVSGFVNVGLGAFAAAGILFAARAAEEVATLRKVPWGVILMVSGVSVLIAVVEKTGGMDRFTEMLAAVATARSVNGVIAFVTGVISTYSSTSGVVLPAFLPTAAKLAAQVGGDPLAIALSINVGSSLVDVSPLSTLGALCVATVAAAEPARVLFRQLLVWGLSMTVVGALFCWLFAGLIASS